MSLDFPVEHDRHGKVPTRITVCADWETAEERLYRLDTDQLDELNAGLKAGKPVRMEYVVFGADSLGTVKQTHSRYFWGDYEALYPAEISYRPGLRAESSAMLDENPVPVTAGASATAAVL